MRDLERSAREVFAAVVEDCDPVAAFDRTIEPHPGAWVVDGERFDLGDSSDVRVIAIGKPTLALVGACARALDRAGVPPSARRGVAALPLVDAARTSAIAGPWLDVVPAGHPVPDEGSFRAGRKLLDLCSIDLTSRTRVIALVGGGGSAMAEWPHCVDASAGDFAELNSWLVRGGLSISEINAIRKRISRIKGGRLAIASRPARLLTLVVSDVARGDVASVASGPTMEDESSRQDAIEAIAKAGLSGVITSAAGRLVHPSNLSEPPAWTDTDRARAHSVVLLEGRDTAAFGAKHAERVADVVVNLGEVDGPVEVVVEAHVAALARLTAARPATTCAVVSSGEATVDVRGSGTGGRNQHLALLALLAMRDRQADFSDFALLSAGTDGVDGNSGAAGAVAGPGLLEAARGRGLDAATAFAQFDSAGFFAPLGAQIVCGPTGTNVRDLRVFIGIGR